MQYREVLSPGNRDLLHRRLVTNNTVTDQQIKQKKPLLL